MNIKSIISQRELLDDFGLVTYEIDNCIRQIMAWIMIGENVSRDNTTNVDNLCGWGQDVLIRTIVIDAFKIVNCKKYIIEILQKSALKQHIDTLITKSNLSFQLSALRRVITPWQPIRNKRFAHIEKFDLKKEALDLIKLAETLVKLRDSVSFIMHYVSNSKDIASLSNPDVQSSSKFTLDNKHYTLDTLYNKLKDDRIIKTMRRLVESMRNFETEPY